MPNTFAYIALFSWPLLAILFYKRFDALTASFITIVGGYMFLPASTMINLPLVPALGKDEISGVSALLGTILIKRMKISLLGRTPIQTGLLLILLAIPIMNVFFNTEPVFNGEEYVKGLTVYDAVSQVIEQYLFLVPYIIGISVVTKRSDIERVLKYIIVAGLVYSVLAIIEIRLSPQLHTWTYGFFPHSFAQQVRMGGFRPVVFMGHGLLVALFFMICCACAFVRVHFSSRKEKSMALAYLMFFITILLFCKTVSSVIWLILFVCVFYMFLFVKNKLLWLIFFGFATYPLLSLLGFVPYDYILATVQTFSEDRHASLRLRFVNEIQLLQHTQDRWYIGWGGWGRNRLHDSITDGHWIIVYSQYGFFYFISYFSLFIIPAISSLNNKIPRRTNTYLGSIVLILLIVLLDQLINSSLGHNWIWFISGVLQSCIALAKETNNSLD